MDEIIVEQARKQLNALLAPDNHFICIEWADAFDSEISPFTGCFNYNVAWLLNFNLSELFRCIFSCV